MKPLPLELHQLDRRYTELRVSRDRSEARLLASIAERGQATPVLVCAPAGSIAPEAGRYVLIDGYRRVSALERLGRDTVEAVCTGMAESEVLMWHHQMESRGRRSAMEEGWLVRELHHSHRLSCEEIAKKLARSKGWVSTRLGLVETLPESVQTLVRKGKLCAHAAQRYLVPLARANIGDCEALTTGLAKHRLSTRAMRRVYVAWRKGDAAQRRRIVEQPALFAAAAEAVEEQSQHTQGHAHLALISAKSIISDNQFTDALDELSALACSVSRALERRDPDVPLGARLGEACLRAQTSIAQVTQQLEKRRHAGQ